MTLLTSLHVTNQCHTRVYDVIVGDDVVIV